jgi:BMFP domain-containing protein YqiC
MIQDIFQQGLQATIKKMELIPREEFDIQCEILKKLHQKVRELERRLAILEKSSSVF